MADFHTWMDLSRKAATWGRSGDVNKLMETIDKDSLILGAVLRIAEFADLLLPIAKAIDQQYRNKAAKWLQEYFAQIDEAIEEQLRTREAKHGRCPKPLRWHLAESAMYSACYAWIVADCFRRDHQRHVRIDPPPKGTDMRREYDKWMKRKGRKSGPQK